MAGTGRGADAEMQFRPCGKGKTLLPDTLSPEASGNTTRVTFCNENGQW